MINNITSLFKNPKTEYRKIAPFIKRRLVKNIRPVFEYLKISALSKQYPHHTELLKYINKENCFFVECGANDGVFQDPTYYLEKIKGWNGILIEPIESYANNCRRRRSKSKTYNIALVSNEYKKDTVTIIDCGPMSIIKGVPGYESWVSGAKEAIQVDAREIEVTARTLNSVLEEEFIVNQRKIELLVIDVEGFEIEVMKGFDLVKYLPEVILIEIQEESRKKEFESLLKDRYVLRESFSNRDFIYTLK